MTDTAASPWDPMLAAARDGVLKLQLCGTCGTAQYPPRELCGNCLGEDLRWQSVDNLGTVLAVSVLHVSNEEYYRSRLPWRIATVKLECGPVVFVNLPGSAVGGGARVRVAATAGSGGPLVLEAVEAKG